MKFKFTLATLLTITLSSCAIFSGPGKVDYTKMTRNELREEQRRIHLKLNYEQVKYAAKHTKGQKPEKLFEKIEINTKHYWKNDPYLNPDYFKVDGV